jgi:hypothetical protein
MIIEYKDKDVDKVIHTDLTEQFKKDDRTGYRDDQEIYGSAKKVVERYINEIKADSTQQYAAHVLESFENLREEFDREWDKRSTGWKLCTDNKNLINALANKIDNAEKIVLDRLAQHRAIQPAKDIENNKKAGSEFFQTSSQGEIKLTAATNRPKIQEVLGILFKNDSSKKYLIDYSGSTNTSIKNNMIAKIGIDKCWISYDSKSGTYPLKDSEGNALPSRALVREGVKLTPEAVVSEQAKKEMDRQLSKRTENLLNREITDTQKAELVKLVPAGLRSKLNEKGVMSDFLSKVDKRVGEMIKEAKQNGYELRQDAVSKLNFSSGLMEAHFMYNNIHTGESAKKDMTVWADDKEL